MADNKMVAAGIIAMVVGSIIASADRFIYGLSGPCAMITGPSFFLGVIISVIGAGLAVIGTIESDKACPDCRCRETMEERKMEQEKLEKKDAKRMRLAIELVFERPVDEKSDRLLEAIREACGKQGLSEVVIGEYQNSYSAVFVER